MQWSKDALKTLRAEYEREIELLAEKLRPRFESGELRGFWAHDAPSLRAALPEGR